MQQQFWDGENLEWAYRLPENREQDAPEEDRSILEGSGQGLTLHSTLMAVIGGSLTVSSHPGQYTRLRLELPGSAWKN